MWLVYNMSVFRVGLSRPLSRLDICPMKFRLSTLLIVVAIAAIMIVPVEFVLRGPRSVLMGFDRSMQRAFDAIKLGTDESELHKRFGEPWSSETYFSRAISYRESEFSANEIDGCKAFVTWINGGNWFYCFGIDENGKIVLKADGHS